MATAFSAILLAFFASLLCITAVVVASPVALGSKDAPVTKNAANTGNGVEVETGGMVSADMSRIVEDTLQEEVGVDVESSQIQLGTSKVWSNTLKRTTM